ncbi:hypothetical protein LCGC14_0943400 [marine sediment metagenome]|uniref:Uncharacterized protein n=1 Tax=marine sediment metagenome TaxID=412755 RepID=A0A0F9P5G4_9ZZZZ
MKICPKCKRQVYNEVKHGNFKCPWMSCGKGKEIVTPIDITNNSNPELSLIIAYSYSEDKNRQKALELLIHNINKQKFTNFEVIAIEQAVLNLDNKNSFPYKHLVDKYILLKDPKQRPFNKSWVMNVGARYASTDNLLFIDADILFESDFLQKINNNIPYFKLFKCWSQYECMSGRDNPYTRIHTQDTISCLIGVWYCEKKYYFNVLGGYNENYFGYGREDNDIWQRARYLLNQIPCINYSLSHYYHHWHEANGANPYNVNDKEGDRVLKITNSNPQKVINILTTTNIGQLESPTLIEV